nr:hypothetical protein [uncultured Shewanella sp.]
MSFNVEGFVTFFFIAVFAQIKVSWFHPFLYWITIIASTTLDITLADFVDRSLGIGYLGGSLILITLLVLTLLAWQRTLGSINVSSIRA